MPLTMIVFCSWVTFFLIKTEKGGEVPARTALGANSILSIVNVGFGGKSRNEEFMEPYIFVSCFHGPGRASSPRADFGDQNPSFRTAGFSVLVYMTIFTSFKITKIS